MEFARKLNRTPKIILGIVALLIVFRLCLPSIVKWYVNKTLADIPGYYGHVEDIDIALWRGSYQIIDMKFMKQNGKIREPYFSAKEIDLAVDWKALFQGSLSTKIMMNSPQFTIVKGETADTTQVSVDEKWQTQVQKLYPFEINSFIIHDGSLRFKNETTKPKIDVSLSRLEAEGKNFTNATDNDKNLFASVNATALIQRHGHLTIKSTLNPFKDPLHADFNGKIEGLPLRELNDFAKAYGDFDFEKGVSSFFVEFVTAKNQFTGYAKLMMEKVDILDWNNEKGDSFTHKLWEGMIGAGFEILENQPEDRFALRLPMSGRLDDIKVDGWSTFLSILKNAFVEALPKRLENSLSLKSLKSRKDEKKK